MDQNRKQAQPQNMRNKNQPQGNKPTAPARPEQWDGRNRRAGSERRHGDRMQMNEGSSR